MSRSHPILFLLILGVAQVALPKDHAPKARASQNVERFRILIVDDHEFIRKGVRANFAGDARLVVCGEAANGKEAIEQVQRLSPHAVILDISMPVMNGLDAATEIRRLAPKTKIVILTMHDAAQMRDQAQKAGADAFVVKSEVAAKLTNIVRFLLEIQTETV